MVPQMEPEEQGGGAAEPVFSVDQLMLLAEFLPSG